ncbi:MAG: UvrD-helicase domain-containing protein [Pseudodesulfovibrio sp.]|uniref:DNA 3'-5' helicase n=1 Tax=Pseudodesulfovibrio aespoeensis (strain ATCC 700646 / DSM 10631 / Aspo-2) TaxID=643562 RepID=E6VZN9_PSEA9|nr:MULTISPECIES: UvrD-helicase domain-containing protein [Pseudodesulfovibrio]MBU4244739.1 UvrD-helicase domain-containing protein [Pseudomonadota bacterium]ADU62867.1 UvrD/REP helicase [Pseudodesulfovibrio aespoeensis Aspo-2]MBU4473669.1 UvrD-helicase domain-containing protein [Pseudomonadota bacterium]MBU4515548.1 UvrD-helicase domain-containing protein [Pseudomonadota bacterium]MBU4523218.1 UvrD-helicase domain-containing protein [Pseudomonadota bacterium]
MSELKQVKASAGSGKTFQLTRRFLSLLDRADQNARPFACAGRPHRGYAWPEIMAVTFTNKAAAEMKERVVKGLKLAALDLDNAGQRAECSPEAASRAIDAILRRYHRLNIRTIDSLLALLLRLFALEFGIRPDFRIAFDETDLFDTVYEHFTSLCDTDCPERELLFDAMETMLRAEGRKSFWLQDSVRDRLGRLTTFLRDQSGPIETDQETIKGMLAVAHAGFQRSVAAMRGHIAESGMPAHANFMKFLMKCESMALFDEVPDSTLIQKPTFADCVLAKGKGLVDARSESFYFHLQEAWKTFGADHAVLSGAYFLAPAIAIAQRLLNGLATLQKQRGLVLGSALAGFVNDLLQHGDAVSEAYCRMGCRLHHLLVDEFQDTSREQWQAVTPLAQECLAKGGSLFYVGDIKQAIYGWRGGDSALFGEVMTQPDLASLALTTASDTLPDNWRSFENVVAFNNAFFGNLQDPDLTRELADTIFTAAPDDFRADFATDLTRTFDGCAQSVPQKNAGTGGYVRMERLEGGKADEVEEQTLDALGTLMDQLTARRRFGEIAVLVRSHDHAGLVCDLLVSKGIPVITEKSLQLDRHPLVRQLAAFLAFLDFPRDDVAFLTFASGEELFLAEAGITQAEFHDWLMRPRKRPLGVQFREDFPEHWQRFIEPFYNQSGLMTPYDLTREAMRVFRALERHPQAELYLRRFLEVVHLAEENGYGSLSAFLEYWSGKSAEEKVPLPENIDAVRIMTIYKAKGLEFPVVIVPFHNWTADTDKDYEIRQFKGARLLTPLKKGLGKPYHASLGRTVREQLNLLYVAWTRAREELYGFFTEKPATSPALAAMHLFLDLDGSGLFERGQRPAEVTTTRTHAPAALPASPLAARTDQDGVRLMGWLPRLRVYRHHLDEYFYNERMRGEVAHRAMEHLRVTGHQEADSDRAVRLAMRDFPALDALPPDELVRLETDLRAMTLWALGQDNLCQWLATGQREPEVMDTDGSFKRLDLLHRGESTVVADFKTGQPSPKNREQVFDYMRILEEMPGTARPVHGYLVYLDLREIHRVEKGA